jgi:hypothetical protein
MFLLLYGGVQILQAFQGVDRLVDLGPDLLKCSRGYVEQDGLRLSSRGHAYLLTLEIRSLLVTRPLRCTFND